MLTVHRIMRTEKFSDVKNFFAAMCKKLESPALSVQNCKKNRNHPVKAGENRAIFRPFFSPAHAAKPIGIAVGIFC
jgi:hypothetical protein